VSLPQKDFQFLESTISLCPFCLQRTDAKIIEKNGKIFVLKYCPEHGEQEEILEEDAEYYKSRMLYTKPGTVSKTQTVRKRNCPFDCGLCPEHEQHTCIGLIEVTNACNLGCPTCYAKSGTGDFLPLEKIDEMLDFFLDSEFGSAEILQISGGEPTIHPNILEIIQRAREKKIKYVMLNTNGIRIAEDEDFVRELSQFVGDFEIYLQLDGFEEKTHRHLRGRNMQEIKMKAIEHLKKYNIPVTLVSTIERGINDHEIGKIVEFGINTSCVRGINFQPVAFFGRLGKVDTKNRITITGIIKKIEEQTAGMIGKKDFIPLPCNVDRVAISYLLRQKGGFSPLLRNLDVKNFLPAIRNTFKFDPEDFLNDLKKNALCSSESCCNPASLIRELKKFLPRNYMLKSESEKAEYITENVFRISVTSFVDAYNFDMKSMKKECVHIITPDLKKIPFSSYNMLYRK